MQSSEPGTHHAADAADLFAPTGTDDGDDGDVEDMGGIDDEEEVDERELLVPLESRAGSPESIPVSFHVYLWSEVY